MFKKLREKVGAESPEKDGSSSPGVRRSSMPVTGHGRSYQRGMHKADTSSSFSNMEEYSTTMSKEDLLSALKQRTTQVKRFEIRLADYGQSIKDIKRERDKLTVVLEKQQDSALKRMTELEQTFADGKTSMENTISGLEKRELELTGTVERLEVENEKLRASVEEWENEKEDFATKRDQFFAKRDNSEELQDLQMQEMAKLKHMLMRSEKDCEAHRNKLDKKLAELLQCQDTAAELESSLRQTTDSLNSTREQLENQIKQNENKTAKAKILENMVSDIKSQNSELKHNTEALNTELKKCQSSLSALEFSYTEVSEKYESLKHSSESIIKKATMDLDEKASTIDHLRKKISSLERRITTDGLPENEQVQALNVERNSLENRLEESHLQLNNIKSTWSIKINQLEQQVSNLNSKIAEDSRELSAKDEEISMLKMSNSKTVSDLQAKLRALENEVEKSEEQNENYLKQATKLEADAIEVAAKYNLERSKLNSTIEEVNKVAKLSKTKLGGEIAQLQKSLEEYVSKTRELEAELSSHKKAKKDANQLLSEAKHSHDLLTDKCESFGKSCQDLEESCKQLEAKLQETEMSFASSAKNSEDLENQLSTSQNSHKELSLKLDEATSELVGLRQQVAEKEKDLLDLVEFSERNKHETDKLNERINEMKTSLQSREEELMNCKEEIATLRNSQAEDDDTVSTLKAEKVKFEEKVTERERTIKVQQQRLNDLKKALNKELNKRSSGAMSASARTASPARHKQVNGLDGLSAMNGSQENIPDMSAIGTMSIDDPNLSTEQREINAKYLKHVILTFLGSSQSEAQQLIKAMSMLLSFNKDEEKFVKETLEYRTSWFGSKPSTKNVVPSAVKHRKR